MNWYLKLDPDSVPKGQHWRLSFEYDEFTNGYDLAYERMTSNSEEAKVGAIMSKVELGSVEMRWLRGLLDEAIAKCDRELTEAQRQNGEL